MEKIDFLIMSGTKEKFKELAKEKDIAPSKLYREALDFYLAYKISNEIKLDIREMIESIVSKKILEFQKRLFSMFVKIITYSKLSIELNEAVLKKALNYEEDLEKKRIEIEDMVIAKLRDKNKTLV